MFDVQFGIGGELAGMAVRAQVLRIANAGEARRRAFLVFAALAQRLSGLHRLIICLDTGDDDTHVDCGHRSGHHPPDSQSPPLLTEL